MSNYKLGHDAEKTAAGYLQHKGFKIHELNWKNRYAEIDIIAEKSNRIYFIEVKSRSNSHQGSGLDYITDKKLKQMSFAAEMWVQEQGWNGEYQLAAISIDSGAVSFIEDI